MPFCLTDLLGSVVLGGDKPGVVTNPVSDIVKHPICVRRERMVALNRLMPRLSLLRAPQNAARRFLFSLTSCALPSQTRTLLCSL